MFDNLSPLEKKLAICVGALVPVVLLFLGFFWFMDSYDANANEIAALEAQIEEQDQKTKAGILASQRQRYYRKVSLPSKQSVTRSLYNDWLTNLVRKDCGMTFNGVIFKDSSSIIYERYKIASREVFSLKPKGTLPQVIEFLYRFHSADHLHRINKLTIRPLTKSVRGKKSVLTGEVTLSLEIETLQLVDGPQNLASFPAFNRELPPIDQYKETILARNIFGPANNAPKLEKPKSLKHTIAKSAKDADGKYVTIQIAATDIDKEDVLSFEIVEESGKESSVKGIVLGDQPITSSQRKISLRVPMQFEPKTIPLTVAVSDDGMPAKGDEIKFSVVFSPPKKSGPPAKDPDPIDLATLTFVRGLMRGVDGKWKALVFVQTKAESHQLAAGDTLSLDDKEWKVVDVNKKQVTFEVDGVQKSYSTNSSLSKPL